MDIFFPIRFYIWYGCSKEPSQSDSSFEYLQHMFWVRNKKHFFLVPLLTKGMENGLLQQEPFIH